MTPESGNEHCCWIYILECRNGALYTGYSTDIIKRYLAHKAGKVKYTRSFKPKRMAGCWRLFDTKGTAMRIEHFVKKLDRRDKIFIIHNPFELQSLAAAHLGSPVNLVPGDPAEIERAVSNTVKSSSKKNPAK